MTHPGKFVTVNSLVVRGLNVAKKTVETICYSTNSSL